MNIKEALYLVHKAWNLVSHQNIMRPWRKLYIDLEMDVDANPFCEFEEKGDYQFFKEMKELIEKEAQFDEAHEENIKQRLENYAEIPRHEICGEDGNCCGVLKRGYNWFGREWRSEAEEDEIVSSVCIPLQAALESADLLLRFMEQQDDNSYTDILHLQKNKMNIGLNKKFNSAKVQKKMTESLKKNNQ